MSLVRAGKFKGFEAQPGALARFGIKRWMLWI
jgi:hypothetical protein